MKLIVLLVACVAGGWYWFVGSRQISEDNANDFYRQQMEFTIERDAKALCALLEAKYIGHSVMISDQKPQEETSDKKQTCDKTAELFATAKTLSEKTGQEVSISATTHLDSIVISADKKVATVVAHGTFSMNIAGLSMINLKFEGTDVLVKSGGKVLQRSADTKVFPQ